MTMKYILSFCAVLLLFSGCEEGSFGGVSFDGASIAEGNAPGNSGDTFGEIIENDFVAVSEEPTSTFSIDADGGSYSILRRMVEQGQNIPAGALRTEEMINYFQYDYLAPSFGDPVPIALNGEIASCPWNTKHHLLRVGMQGRALSKAQRPASNIVLLVDVSGSMSAAAKLDLLQEALDIMVDQLTERDHIAIITYAGSQAVVLEPTSGDQKSTIKEAIRNMKSGGSTYGSAAIEKAYELAVEQYKEGGNNRVVLCSDGDFNVGLTSVDELKEFIAEKRDTDVYLTTVGVGFGVNDQTMEQLANKGNGVYEYIDNIEQAEKVFDHEWNKFFTVAEDVKVQINFNSNVVEQYRLIGYENRLLANEDFEDDEKDAGEIGSDQSVTALYELKLADGAINYRSEKAIEIDFRYKDPQANTSKALSLEVKEKGTEWVAATENMRFASAVAGLAMIVNDSKYKEDLTLTKVREMVEGADTYDPHDYKEGLIEVLKKME